jgi:hypothetical protein
MPPADCSSMQHFFLGMKVRTVYPICTPHWDCTGDSRFLPYEENIAPE